VLYIKFDRYVMKEKLQKIEELSTQHSCIMRNDPISRWRVGSSAC
jgi:hypothetical protein